MNRDGAFQVFRIHACLKAEDCLDYLSLLRTDLFDEMAQHSLPLAMIFFAPVANLVALPAANLPVLEIRHDALCGASFLPKVLESLCQIRFV